LRVQTHVGPRDDDTLSQRVSRFGLPVGLLSQARERVAGVGRLASAVFAAGLIAVVAMLVADAAPTPLIVVYAAGNTFNLIVATVLHRLARGTSIASTTILMAALAWEVELCLFVNFSSHYYGLVTYGHLLDMTGALVVIVMFALVIPTPPRKVVATAVLAASTNVVAIGILEASDIGAFSLVDYVQALARNAIAVLIAYYGSRTIYRLNLDVARAQQLGSYELEAPLGSGGMGEVWHARHTLLKRPAALKLIRPEVLGGADVEANRRALERFEREARVTAMLSSPHTVELYDYGFTEDQTFYYVMEKLHGLDLEHLVREYGPVEAARAVHLLLQVCDSLGDAHNHGLVHRDVKPANIYLCRQGMRHDFVKVLDFGLVRDVSENQDPETRAAVGGTPAYMAPEAARGGEIDARTDLYAVGCVGFWLLTGQSVFEADSIEEMFEAHIHDAPVAPSTLSVVDISPELDRVIMTCLAKDPAERCQSAAELMDALEAVPEADGWDEDRAEAWWKEHASDALTSSEKNRKVDVRRAVL